MISSWTSGTDTGTITCSFTANTSARTATIRVTAVGAMGSPQDVKVIQAGQPVLSVSPVSLDVAKGVGTTTFNISNQSLSGKGTMPWTAAVTSGVSWLEISGTSGTDTGTITCSFTANTSSSARTATIRVIAVGATDTPQYVTVTQSRSLAASLDGLGLFVYNLDSSTRTQIDPANPENMIYSGSTLYADFGAFDGLRKWDGTAWTQLSPDNPENMVASGSTLYASFKTLGLYKWDGAALTQLSPTNPENMVASGSTLYADFGASGLWKLDGTAWTQLSPYNPENMVELGPTLYADFGVQGGVQGILKRDGAAWTQLSLDNPVIMAISN